MYNEEKQKRCDDELVADVKFTVIIPGKSLIDVNDKNRSDWTLEMLTVAIDEKLRSKKCGEYFSSFCEVSLLAFAPVHIRSAVIAKSEKNRLDNKVFDDNTSPIVHTEQLYSKGSYVYFANPDYDPHASMVTSTNDPFYVGRVVRVNELGT